MKCSVCNKKAEANLKHLGVLCKECFSRTIEKRIRKTTRINRIFKKNDNILVFDKLSFFMVNKIVKDLPKKIFFYKEYNNISQLNTKPIKDCIKKNKINRIIIPWTLDDEINQFLEQIFLNKKIKENEYIKLFKDATEEELDLFSKFNKIEYIKNKKNKGIEDFINKVEDRYTGTKFKLKKSYDRLSGLL